MHAFWLVLSEGGNHQARSGEAFIGRSDPDEVQRRLKNGMGQITRPLGTHGVDPAAGLRAQPAAALLAPRDAARHPGHLA